MKAPGNRLLVMCYNNETEVKPDNFRVYKTKKYFCTTEYPFPKLFFGATCFPLTDSH